MLRTVRLPSEGCNECERLTGDLEGCNVTFDVGSERVFVDGLIDARGLRHLADHLEGFYRGEGSSTRAARP